MREIKFRAFEGNEVSSPFMDNSDDYESLKLFFDEYVEDEVSFMQYTGLKDKNGVEIYEGDIVKTTYEMLIIDWNNDLCRFCLRRLQTRIKWVGDVTYLASYEVIGNIYEDKELLND